VTAEAPSPEPTAALRPLLDALADDAAVRAVVTARTEVVACPDAARAPFLAAVSARMASRVLLVAVPTVADAERLVGDLRAWCDPGTVELFGAWETLPFERVSPNLETMGRRLRTMWRLRRRDPDLRIVVAPIRALVQRLGPHVEDTEPLTVTRGAHCDRDRLVARLVEMGYRREYQVEARGEVAVRGSIVDVFGATDAHPVRIDLWGDEVERITEFSVADQRSRAPRDTATVFAARELLPTPEVRARAAGLRDVAPWGITVWERLAAGETFDGMEAWLPWLCGAEHLLTDLLPPDARVLVVEPRRCRDRAAELAAEEAELAGALAATWDATPPPGGFPRLILDYDRLLAHTRAGVVAVTAGAADPATPTVAAVATDPLVGDLEAFCDRVRRLHADGYRVVLATTGPGPARRLREVLGGAGIDAVDGPGAAPGCVSVVTATLERGVVLAGARVAVIAEADLTGRRRVHRPPRAPAAPAGSFDDLRPGDHVVHHVHGVGRYEGIVRRAIGGAERDYLSIAYRGNDRLYVPTDQVGLVRRYTGGESPTLSRMGGADWERTRSRVRSAVAEVAAELVELYRRRLATPGRAFGPDTPWQAEMEAAFEYEETPDQQRAIDEVKADMERPVPMDRLVCGDVGFGKTEVALRAAFKAVQDGAQVAVLVPTTLLATQHHQTFRERFAPYPVRVELLSRFVSAREQAAVVAGLASGSVDVVIGTHRLLSDDVRFSDLGLLIIDEEQRFGVAHKERIKRLRASVDVLTLTATPIPRTLEMSLTGIRDLSLVQTPPEARQPILTYVGEYDDRVVAEAIRRELLREGQVFYVHNRVQDIEHVAARVQALVPDARIAVAHGQMDESRLERTVLEFADRRSDVLVCTTIVESGLDMPTVNTLVVDRADRLGLAQLYQLRGRVGRRGQRAYAYLLYPPDRVLTEEAYERLKAIGEFTDLGSGYRLAMRDLEIRGAGNLLGGAQHGHIAAVGFDLYCELVAEAVDALRGVPREEPFEVVVDLPVDAHLPAGYVSREDVRMEAYRRLAACRSEAEVEAMRAEWTDRFGPPPPPAEALLEVAALRVECLRLRIPTVTVVRGVARLGGLHLAESRKVRLRRLAPRAVAKDGEVVVPLGGPPAEAARRLTGLLRELVPPEPAPAVAAGGR
jgi:transcription-repair coupling factor (superfamily II helicase)